MIAEKDRKAFLESLVGRSNGRRTMAYAWRDVILYALGVGAHMEDLPYVYEKGGLKVLPAFAVLPYLNSIMVEPRVNNPIHPFTIVKEAMIEQEGRNIGGLHMAMNIELFGKIDPMQGTILIDDHVAGVYDRGEGKGVGVRGVMDLWDIAGNKLARLTSDHVARAWGGFGGEKMPSEKIEIPDRDPDFTAEEQMAPTQALLYRLLGDVNDVHVDVNLAQSLGYEKPFMMGMCTYGYAARMAIQEVIPYEPERVTRIYGQMRSLCFPGEKVRLAAWKMDEHRVHYRLLNDSGKAVIDKGILEFR